MAHLFTFQIVNNCSLRRKGCGPTCFPWLSVDCTCHRTLCCCQNTKFMSLFYDRWLTHTHTHFISGAFTKLLKESNSFVLSVWPFFCPSLWNSSAPTKLIFMNFTFFFFRASQVPFWPWNSTVRNRPWTSIQDLLHPNSWQTPLAAVTVYSAPHDGRKGASETCRA